MILEMYMILNKVLFFFYDEQFLLVRNTKLPYKPCFCYSVALITLEMGWL